jgi:hypothetical protein
MQPGYFLIKKLGISETSIALALSMGLNGVVLYYLSFFIPLTPAVIWIYAILMAGLFIFARPKLKIPSFAIPKKIEKAAILVLMVLLVLYFLASFNKPSSWDTYSYHVPVINEFLERGQLPVFENPINGYQAGIMAYPYAMHVFIASVDSVTGLRLDNFLIFYFILIVVGLLYSLSNKQGEKTFLAPLFFLSSLIVFSCGTNILSDIYSTAIFLAGLFFLLKVLKGRGNSSAVLNGVCFGIMFLVKPLGLFYYAANCLFLLFHRKWKQTALSVLGFATISGLYAVKLFIQLPSMSERWGTATLDASYSATQYLFNLLSLGESFISLVPHLFVPALVVVILIIIKKEYKTNIFLKTFIFFSIFYALLAPLNLWFYHPIGFSRFIFPLYALLCLSAIGEAKKLILSKNKLVRFISIIFFIGLIISSVFLIAPSAMQSKMLAPGGENIFISLLINPPNFITPHIPNEEGLTVFWANAADNPIVYGFEKVRHLDTHISSEPTEAPCDFLKRYNVDYVIFITVNTGVPGPWKEFKKRLGQSLEKEECAKTLAIYSNLNVYKTDFD